MIHVSLLGADAMGDYVLVHAATGVTYDTQCAGYACEQRSAEGFLVPVWPPAAVMALDRWFKVRFRGHCHTPERDWTPENAEQLAKLLADIECDSRDAHGEYRPTALTLDRSRLDECVEAWIPVHTPFGPGVLLRENSD
jgi:hypothetical protein